MPVTGHATMSRAQSKEAIKKTLRRAKITYHPDKQVQSLHPAKPNPTQSYMLLGCKSLIPPCAHVKISAPSLRFQVSSGDLEAKVRAEEISKILNSWDLATI